MAEAERESGRGQRLGILGGTFDPPHVGHLIVAQDAWARLELDRLILVPARVPPHKPAGAPTAPELRLEMTRAAIAGDGRFQVDELELRRQGPSYTVDTLRTLAERHPDAELFLLLGADQLSEFASWREPQEVARLARLAVFDRLDLSVEQARSLLERDGVEVAVERVDVTRIDVSSTMIRERVRLGLPIRYLVPAGVEEVVRREGLYRLEA